MSHYALMVLHSLSMVIWLGGHALLLLGWCPEAWRSGDPRLLVDALLRLYRVALPALLVSIVSGLWLAWHWQPETALWFTPDLPASRLILGKLALLFALLLVHVYVWMRVIPTLTPDRIGRLCLCIALQVLIAATLVGVGTGFRYSGA